MGKAKAWVFDIPSSINERSAKEVAADPVADERKRDNKQGEGKYGSPKVQRLMTIAKAKYPYAKSDEEVLAAWFYDVDKLAQRKEQELADADAEHNDSIGFIELQVNDLNDQIETFFFWFL